MSTANENIRSGVCQSLYSSHGILHSAMIGLFLDLQDDGSLWLHQQLDILEELLSELSLLVISYMIQD